LTGFDNIKEKCPQLHHWYTTIFPLWDNFPKMGFCFMSFVNIPGWEYHLNTVFRLGEASRPQMSGGISLAAVFHRGGCEVSAGIKVPGGWAWL